MTAYPTRYAAFSDSAVRDLFSSPCWFGDHEHPALSLSERREACQEVGNRLAAARGSEAREVLARPLTGGTFGCQSGEQIVLNKYALRDSCFAVDSSGESGEAVSRQMIPYKAMNWHMLETIFHEDWHGVQEDQCRECLNRVYMDPEKGDPYLYRIQDCEKEAFAVGHSRALDAIANYTRENGKTDANATIYVEHIQKERFDDMLHVAQKRYGADVEQTLTQVAQDRYYGKLPESASESYSAVDAVFERQKRRQSMFEEERPELSETNPADRIFDELEHPQENTGHAASEDVGQTQGAAPSCEQNMGY